MMHNCPPPLRLLARWLRGVARNNGNYGHMLFEQATPIDDALIDGLRPYFESAHLDARDYFLESHVDDALYLIGRDGLDAIESNVRFAVDEMIREALENVRMRRTEN